MTSAPTLAEWLSIVGKNYDEPVVSALRTRLGLKGKGPRVDNFGDEKVPAQGVAIMLTRTTVNDKPNKGAYGITFYARPHGERVSYAGALPHALTWSETQASVRARLGEPQTHAQLANSDGYEFGDYSLSVEYVDDAGSSIKVVQIRLSKPGGNLAGALPAAE
jgi:hypothetical protein